MALTIDIKSSNEFEKSALRTAEALEQISKQEQHINDLSKKLGRSHTEVAKAVKHVREEDKAREKKESEASKARLKEESVFRDNLKAAAAGLYIVKNAAVAAYETTMGLGKALIDAAYSASKTEKGAASMINAFTGGHGAEAIKILDSLAGKLGEKVVDVRAEFIKFRQAGMTSDMSFQLVKTTADLKALGLSAAQVETEVSAVTAKGFDRYGAARALKSITDNYKGVGTGAVAAGHGVNGLDQSMNRLSNAVDDELVKFWGKIGPDISKAARELSNFAVSLLKSKDGQAFIQGVADALKNVAAVITKENLAKSLEGIKTVVMGIKTVFEQTGKAIGYAASQLYDFYKAAGVSSGPQTGPASNGGAWSTVVKTVTGQTPDAIAKQFKSLGGAPPAATPVGPAAGNTTININLQGDIEKANEIARSIRQELLLLQQAGALSRGLVF